MTNRAIIGVEPDVDWTEIQRGLLELGAEDVRGPSAELPDVLVATVKSESETDQFLEAAKALPGVRYAEPDSWSWTY